MNPYFQKLYWKTFFRRKRKEFKVFFKDGANKIKNRETYRFLIWKLTREGIKKRKNNLPEKKRKRWLFYKPRYLKIFFNSSKKPRWFLISSSVTVVFLITAAIIAISFPILKEYKFRKFEKTARAAFKNDDFHTSLLTSLTAHLAIPKDLGILRILVNSARKLSHPRFLEWAQTLENHPSATVDDRLIYCRACIEKADWEEAARLLFTIQTDNSGHEEYAYLLCQVYLADEELGELKAFETAYNFLQEKPDSLKLREFFWNLCLRSDQNFFYEEGLKDLEAGANSKGEISRAAQRRLLRLPHFPQEQKKHWANQLWKSGQPTMMDALICLDASYGKEKLDLDNLLFVLGQEFRQLHQPEKKKELAQMLNRLGRPEMARELIGQIAQAQTINPDEFKERMLSTIKTAAFGQKIDLAREISFEIGPTLSQNERAFFNQLLSDKDKNHSEESDLFGELFAEANNEELENFRQFAVFFNQPQIIVSYLEELEKRKPKHVGIKYILISCYQRLGEFDKLRQILSRTPLPTEVINFSGEHQTCIFKSLYGQELENCKIWAENALVEYPQSPSLRFTLALIYLKMGESQSARALISPYWSTTPPNCPTQRLIGAWTLAENNLHKEAKKWAPVNSISFLTDVEKVILEKIISINQ